VAYLKKPGGYARKSFGSRPSFGAKRNSYGDSTERFQATCNECHKKCEVPFRPNGKKPVYCRDCFKGKEETPSYGARRSYQERGPQGPDVAQRLDAIEAKLDRILKSLQ
jgi:CxxC-x17-CxxC domain-containing protein